MNQVVLALITLATLTFIGCRKEKIELAQSPQVVQEEPTERISGPMNTIDIVWEEVDFK